MFLCKLWPKYEKIPPVSGMIYIASASRKISLQRPDYRVICQRHQLEALKQPPCCTSSDHVPTFDH